MRCQLVYHKRFGTMIACKLQKTVEIPRIHKTPPISLAPQNDGNNRVEIFALTKHYQTYLQTRHTSPKRRYAIELWASSSYDLGSAA